LLETGQFATCDTIHCNLNTNNFLSIDDLRFGYGQGSAQRIILDGITMRFERGQVVALMGGSGSGKTTLLRLIGGQVKPLQGKVTFEGQVVHELDRPALFALRRKMGVLFQYGALFTDLSVFDNVAFPMREHTKLTADMIRDLVLMKLQAVGLRGAASLMPSQLSGGMARRVALARSIALDPPLLLYDEPFAGLDPISLGTIAQLIKTLNQSLGATSILVTHDVEETFAIADYVYLLANSRIVAHGTPEQLRASTDPFAQQFLNGQRDGPVRFHYPGKALEQDLGLV
jgi:phospholipid/cholesterol/gamma-HCH transport system ATP-binding protein